MKFMAFYKNKYEVKEGTELDIESIVGRFVWESVSNTRLININDHEFLMVYQDGILGAGKKFKTKFMEQLGYNTKMNFILVGNNNWEYRSLSDEEIDILKNYFKE